MDEALQVTVVNASLLFQAGDDCLSGSIILVNAHMDAVILYGLDDATDIVIVDKARLQLAAAYLWNEGIDLGRYITAEDCRDKKTESTHVFLQLLF